jgi:DNA-binding NarL/FixJ family response regulator
MTERIRVLIADDHAVVREGLRAMLATQPDLEVTAEADTGAAAVSAVAADPPDVVLMDLQMPELDGPTAITRIQATHPDVQILVLTTYHTDADITAALNAGATGYLLKDCGRDQLFTAIRAAARGESVLSPAVASRVVHRVRADPRTALSSREIEVLTAVARGHSNKDVARALHVSEATIKTHLLRIYAKLDVTDRTAAVTTALTRGIIRLT